MIRKNWGGTPVILDSVGEFIAVAGGSGWVGRDDDVALVREDLGVPARAPRVVPGALRTTVDEVCERVFLALVEAFGVDDPGVDLSLPSLAGVNQ